MIFTNFSRSLAIVFTPSLFPVTEEATNIKKVEVTNADLANKLEIVQALKLKLIEALLQGHVFLGMVLLSCVSYFHIGSTFQIGLIWFDIGKTKSHLILDENSYLYFPLLYIFRSPNFFIELSVKYTFSYRIYLSHLSLG